MHWDVLFASFPAWTWALVLGSTVFVVIELLKRWISSRLRKTGGQYGWNGLGLLADILSSIYPTMTLAYSAYIGARLIELSPRIDRIIDKCLIIALLLQAAFWGTKLINFGLRIFVSRRQSRNDPSMDTIIPVIRLFAKAMLFVLLVLLALDNLGFNITALLAGLGVGGIAVALAVQNILGDVFSSLSIILDKPFEVGDTINLGDITGTVEKIGLKTTRLKSISGQQIIVSNSRLLSADINNYKRMKERRNLFVVGLTYETPTEKLQSVSQLLEDAVKSQGKDRVRFERTYFKAFSASSLDFEVSYYALFADLTEALQLQERIFIEIIRVFREHNLSLAYPTRTLYLANCDTEQPLNKK